MTVGIKIPVVPYQSELVLHFLYHQYKMTDFELIRFKFENKKPMTGFVREYSILRSLIIYTFISFPICEVFLIKSRIKIFELILDNVRFGISGAFVFFAHIFATFSQQFAIFCFQKYIYTQVTLNINC